MIPDQIRNLYYLTAFIVTAGSVGASYFATRAATTEALRDIIRRLGDVETHITAFQAELTSLARAVSYLEGRINGRMP